MEFVTLQHSELTVSRFCMGGCPLGGHGWGDVSEQNVRQAIDTALDEGVNFFDTADIYGLGKSEELVGQALKDRRKDVVIATKFGVRVQNGKTFYDNSPKWIERAVEGSLKRLGTDYIDLYQLHYRDNTTHISDVIEKLEDLKARGYIRYYGLSNISKEESFELQPYIGKFVSFQDEYSLASRDHEHDLLYFSEHLHMTPMTWGSLGQGILTGKYDSHVTFGPDDRRSRDVYVNFHGEKLEKNMKILNVMREISEQTGRSIPSIAIRFILDHIPDSVVLAGVKDADQLLSNIEAMHWTLSIHQMEQLKKISSDKEATT